MKLIGFKRSDFKGKDGTMITGYSIYLAYPASGDDAGGMICDNMYFTDAKLSMCNYTPRVNDEVTVTYNRYGKAAAILPVSKP